MMNRAGSDDSATDGVTSYLLDEAPREAPSRDIHNSEVTVAKTLTSGAPTKKEHVMFDKRKAKDTETAWEGIPLPTIDVATRKAACSSIPDSQWRDYGDKALVAIARRARAHHSGQQRQ